MGFFHRLNRSADLVTGMADRRGVDFSARIMRNPDAGTESFRALMMRCSACSDQDGCAELQANCDHLDAAPDYCCNKGFFDKV